MGLLVLAGIDDEHDAIAGLTVDILHQRVGHPKRLAGIAHLIGGRDDVLRRRRFGGAPATRAIASANPIIMLFIFWSSNMA